MSYRDLMINAPPRIERRRTTIMDAASGGFDSQSFASSSSRPFYPSGRGNKLEEEARIRRIKDARRLYKSPQSRDAAAGNVDNLLKDSLPARGVPPKRTTSQPNMAFTSSAMTRSVPNLSLPKYDRQQEGKPQPPPNNVKATKGMLAERTSKLLRHKSVQTLSDAGQLQQQQSSTNAKASKKTETGRLQNGAAKVEKSTIQPTTEESSDLVDYVRYNRRTAPFYLNHQTHDSADPMPGSYYSDLPLQEDPINFDKIFNTPTRPGDDGGGGGNASSSMGHLDEDVFDKSINYWLHKSIRYENAKEPLSAQEFVHSPPSSYFTFASLDDSHLHSNAVEPLPAPAAPEWSNGQNIVYMKNRVICSMQDYPAQQSWSAPLKSNLSHSPVQMAATLMPRPATPHSVVEPVAKEKPTPTAVPVVATTAAATTTTTTKAQEEEAPIIPMRTNVKNMSKSLQSLNDLPPPIPPRETASRTYNNKSTKKPLSQTEEECGICGKRVYVMEKLTLDSVCYHKSCFKCSLCSTKLSTTNYYVVNGSPYCRGHYKQALFNHKTISVSTSGEEIKEPPFFHNDISSNSEGQFQTAKYRSELYSANKYEPEQITHSSLKINPATSKPTSALPDPPTVIKEEVWV